MALKYFTYENRKRIEDRLLHETDIAGLPTLGHGVDFGMGEICLEETKDENGNDRFEFYLAVNYDKTHHQVFDNIEDAIRALVGFYKRTDMIDKPDKMEKIIYQEIGLNRDIFDKKYLPEDQLRRRFVKDFLNKHAESRELTEDELRSIITLKKLLDVFKEKLKPLYISDISLSPLRDTPGIDMFKIEDDSWVVWRSFAGIYIGAKNYDSVDDACWGVLRELLKDRWPFGDAAIKIFYKKREENQSIELPELTAFAKENGYTLPKEKIRSKSLFIKK